MARQTQRPRHLLARTVTWLLGGFTALLALVLLGVQVSVWPSALLVRYSFDKGGRTTEDILRGYAPAASAVSAQLDVAYRPGDADALLDVYWPARLDGTGERLPTVVWLHGGGWLAGHKEGTATWARILADKGYTVVVPDYTLAPGAHYPTQLAQTLAALEFLRGPTAPAHVDPDQLVLAGDSAGASLAAQAATVVTHPAYGQEVGVATDVPASAVAGLLLNCGPYDLALISGGGEGAGGQAGGQASGQGQNKVLAWGAQTIGWAYLGQKHYLDNPLTATLSLVDHVYPGFPPAFVSGGNDDPLTKGAKVYAQRLTAAGADVTTLFFPDDYTDPSSGAKLPHEYQFDLRLEAAQRSLDATVEFLATHTTTPPAAAG